MITIVIPFFNSLKNIEKNISLFYPLETDCEILIINDGSTNNIVRIEEKLAALYSEIKFINKLHTGVSDTRNVGIKAARGKYILFLDADDQLEKGSIEALVKFFDSCDDDIDLVTYPIETHYRGKILPPHFRYQTLNHSGIYDLNEYPYIGQTTMNIVVRNKFENNILFDTSMTFSEDQKYCCDVVRNSMKMGFCNEAKYIYNRSDSSSSGKQNGSCYIFEQTMKMFEDIFRDYKIVPAAFQGLYINDLEWKLRAEMLYPYHYDKKSFGFAMYRIRALLAKVDSKIILEHPDIDYFHKFYWLSLKPNANVVPFFTEKGFGIKLDGKIIAQTDKFEIVVIRLRLDNGIFVFRGFIKSPVFSFCEKPELFAIVNGIRIKEELFVSAHSYYFCRTKTNVFYGFCFEIPESKLQSLAFNVRMQDIFYECHYNFWSKAPFSNKYNRYDSIVGNRSMHFDINSGTFYITDGLPSKVLNQNSRMLPLYVWKMRKRAVSLKNKTRIHLYYDCRGVAKDNGYYKFVEDWSKKDGIIRKYIYDFQNKNLRNMFTKEQLKDTVLFGSQQHLIYFLAAEKIFTAYIEDVNIFPFSSNEIEMYSDFFNFEVVYLQHGILHGSLPWKYTPEMVMADKICISTVYEQKLFNEKYHFRKQDVIVEPMRRLKVIDRKMAPQRKILFAPSWRQYLIGPNIDGVWQSLEEVFLNSDYYKNIIGLLNSSQLERLLEEKDYVLDFKLHPIFSIYKPLFNIHNDRVRVADRTDKIEEYAIFITDFSSFAFDFIYLGRKVFSFIPDEVQFKCGMNSYREIEPESKKMFIRLKGAEELYRLFEAERVNADILFYD
ncbi:MAG: bifunctional glycosyltransferase family 2 protein/CDP-glycerol:glycerophosphate glycerophosphotransferase [Eubacterium sp.]|nr:bifunctional glycosyltransferase family 2 protein/CDP-glycerol:glycerophosphate glycerophosphotransferase [Eubacterium sp.]